MSSAARAAGSPERQNRLILFGFIGLAGLAAVLVFLALSNFGEDDGGGSASFGGTINVVTVAEPVSAGTTLTGDLLQLTTLPENGIVEGALTTVDGLEGLVVRQDLAKGEQLTAAKLGQGLDDGSATLSAIVPTGMRAVAVDVDEDTVVGGLVVAGDRVDVLLIYENPAGETVARTLMQDVEVLAVAQETQKPVTRLDKDGNPIETDTAGDELATRPDDLEANEDARTVTLAVSPEDAPLLALAQEEGKVWLALRGIGDSETPFFGPVSIQDTGE
jgi:pilus assembly protein CpaB